MRPAALGLGLIMLFTVGVSAQEPKPRPKREPTEKREASADVTKAPEAAEFLVVPLRVHILRSKDLPDIDCALTDADIERILGKVNQVWSVAGIHFGLESIRREDAENEAEFKKAAPEKGPIPLPLFQTLAPKDSRKFDGQNVYYIHKFSVNGVFLGNRTSFVQETAGLRPVPGGIDEPIPRVTAHELGHALSLPHRQNQTNLLASGTTGTLLNESEVERVRSAARKIKGVVPYDALKKSEVGCDKAESERRKAWAAAVEKLASKKS